MIIKGIPAATAEFTELYLFYEIQFCSAPLQGLLQTYFLINIYTPLNSGLKWVFSELLQSPCFKPSDWFCAAEWNNDFCPVDWREGGDLETWWERSQEMLESLNWAQRLNRAFVHSVCYPGGNGMWNVWMGAGRGIDAPSFSSRKTTPCILTWSACQECVRAFSRKPGKCLLRP